MGKLLSLKCLRTGYRPNKEVKRLRDFLFATAIWSACFEPVIIIILEARVTAVYKRFRWSII
jgi:hypothetical protein